MNLTIDLNVNFPPEIVSMVAKILAGIARLQLGQEKIMTQQEDLKAALDEEDIDIDKVLGLVASESTDIAALQAKLAAAIALAAPDLTPLIAQVQAKTKAMIAVLPAAQPAAV